MKVKIVRRQQGSQKTHYEIVHGLAVLGKFYLPNEVADTEENMAVVEFEVEFPFVVPE